MRSVVCERHSSTTGEAATRGGRTWQLASRSIPAVPNFVHANPPDTKAIPISRTVGADRIVDEIVFSCTHDREIDWLLPGVPPTGKFIEFPMVTVVTLRGNKLYNEHIYWDQASVLVQIGLLHPAGLPVSGAEQSHKLLDRTLPSNRLMPSWPSSEGKSLAYRPPL
jgi:carboxymethylenebutenolidase